MRQCKEIIQSGGQYYVIEHIVHVSRRDGWFFPNCVWKATLSNGTVTLPENMLDWIEWNQKTKGDKTTYKIVYADRRGTAVAYAQRKTGGYIGYK